MTFTDHELDDEQHTVTLNREQIRALERDAKLTREATARAETAERELAMMRAGLDLSTPAAQFFAQHYSGELDADAVRAEAARLGLIVSTDTPAPTPTPEPVTEQPVTTLTDVRDLISTGATGDTGAPPPARPVREVAREEAEAMMKQGASTEDAQAAFFRRLAHAASEGDRTVIIPGFRQD